MTDTMAGTTGATAPRHPLDELTGSDLGDLDHPRGLDGSPEQAKKRRTRRVPAGAEAMARPWRLAIVGLGIGFGLVTRLLAANGVFSATSITFVLAAALTSALAGIGLLTLASERDRFDRWMTMLAVVVGLAMASLQWISPAFADGTLEWSNDSQAALTALGFSNGLLLAGVLTLAFVRRWPTMTVVAVLVAGFVTLMADTVLLRNEWPAIAALCVGFAGVLLAWDQAPRHEPTYVAELESPRISRAALCLATVALAGSVLQLWVSRGEDVGRVLPAAGVSVALLIIALMASIRIRREIQRRDTTISEWTSWMREIRTGDLRSDFENLSVDEGGRVIGDVTGEQPRSLSFPDLRADDGSSPFTPDDATQPIPQVAASAPAIPSDPSIPAQPVAEPEPVAADAPAAAQPWLFGDEPPTAFELLWAEGAEGDRHADDLDAATQTAAAPTPGADQPQLFDFERDLSAIVADGPATAPAAGVAPGIQVIVPDANDVTPAVDAPALVIDEPAPAAVPVAATEPGDGLGAFTSWLSDDAPSSRATIGELEAWLERTPAVAAQRLVVAIETMSLPDFDMLPHEVSAASNLALLDGLDSSEPRPTLLTEIDGPYLMAAWDHVASNRLVALNRTIRALLDTPVETEHGAVALTGTLAMLRPGPDTNLDGLIDDAIMGLVQARRLETVTVVTS